MNTSKIEIVDRRGDRPHVVAATLHLDCGPQQLVAVESDWHPVRMASMQRLLDSGHPADQLPQHYHWDWARKQGRLGLLAYRCFGIECDGRMQGLMMVSTAGHFSRLAPDQGKPLAYVEYIENAPWNVRPLAANPQFGGIGIRLYEAAVRFSIDEGFKGRIGLHSLPQAEAFYAKTCRMTAFDADPAVQGLRYFESTQEQAKTFLQEG